MQTLKLNAEFIEKKTLPSQFRTWEISGLESLPANIESLNNNKIPYKIQKYLKLILHIARVSGIAIAFVTMASFGVMHLNETYSSEFYALLKGLEEENGKLPLCHSTILHCAKQSGFEKG